MLKSIIDLIKSWWNIAGIILGAIAIVIGLFTQAWLYGIVGFVALVIAFADRHLKLVKAVEQSKQVPLVDFLTVVTNPPRFGSIHFFEAFGGNGKFEFVVNCDFTNKLPYPITITCQATIDTDLPIIRDNPPKLTFGTTGTNTLQLKASLMEQPAMRMDVNFYLTPEEQRLVEIATATNGQNKTDINEFLSGEHIGSPLQLFIFDFVQP